MHGNGLQDKKFVTEWGASLRWAHRQREHGRKKKGEDVGGHSSINSVYFDFRKDSAFEDNRKQETRMSVMESLSLFWGSPSRFSCLHTIFRLCLGSASL